jgi:hypothetical protein
LAALEIGKAKDVSATLRTKAPNILKDKSRNRKINMDAYHKLTTKTEVFKKCS